MSQTVAEVAKPGVGEKLTEAIAIHEVFSINIFGANIPISDTVITSWIVMALLIIVSLIFVRNFKDIPGRAQLIIESLVDFIYSFVEGKIHHHGRVFAPFLGTIFIFLIVANVAPLLTPLGGFGFHPPFVIKPLTRDINITAAFAVVVIITVIGAEIRYKGIGGWIGSFIKPAPFMIFFKVLEYMIKPVSLSLRLFGNILGAFIIMQLVELVMPIVAPPIAAMYFDIFDGLIQAVIFSFLSTIYLAEAVE